MSRLVTFAIGMVIVVVDLRLNGFDVLLDPLGWVLVLLAVATLARVDAAFAVAGALAALGLVVSVFTVTQPLSDTTGWIDNALGDLVVLAATVGIHRVLSRAREPLAVEAGRLQWGLVAGLVAQLPFLVVRGEHQPSAADPRFWYVVVVVLYGLAVFVWWITVAIRAARLDVEQPQDPADPASARTVWRS